MNRPVWLLCGVLAAAGCSKKSEEAAPPPKPVTPAKPAKPVPQPITAAAFGKTIAPFGLLTKVKIGMTEAEAKAAAPEFWNDKGREQLTDSPYADLHYGLSFTDGKLNSFRLANLGKVDLKPLLAEAWGPGIVAKTTIDRPLMAWFDPATGWRATVEGDPGDLNFTTYLPVAKLLGDDPVEFAAFGKPILGATEADLRRDYPDAFDLQTPEQMKASAARAEEIAKWAGVKDTSALHTTSTEPSISMRLRPTEWGSFYTTISPMFEKGKVTRYFFTITDDGYPPANETTRALFEKKWGKPKLKKSYKDRYIYHAANPFILVERDASDKGWELHVSPKNDD